MYIRCGTKRVYSTLTLAKLGSLLVEKLVNLTRTSCILQLILHQCLFWSGKINAPKAMIGVGKAWIKAEVGTGKVV